MVFAMQFGSWLLAASPSETAIARTNEISEVIPIKYALASDVGMTLNAQRSGHAGNWVNRTLVTTAEITNLYAQVQALGPKRITSDERSNSLLVTSSPSDLAKIKEIIGKLDVVPTQVLVEGVILEFPLDDRKDSPRARPNGAAHLPSSFSALTNVGILSTTRFTSMNTASKTNPPGTQFSYEATLTGDLDTLVTSLANSQPVKLLQRPRIQTSVGVPATMFAGSGPPYPVGSYTCACPPPKSSLDTGITIEVNCMFTTDGMVLTDIQTKVDKFVGNVTIQNVGDVPVTESYAAEAHVAIRDRQILALGGLVQSTKTPLFSEVAAFEKVPLAGHLLNRIITSPTHTKRYELMVLIRPTIVPTPEAQTIRTKSDKMPSIKSLGQAVLAEKLKRLQATEGDQGAKSE
jgi:general secretion pathway protein D